MKKGFVVVSLLIVFAILILTGFASAVGYVTYTKSGYTCTCSCNTGWSLGGGTCGGSNPCKDSQWGTCYGCGSWSTYHTYSWTCRCYSECDSGQYTCDSNTLKSCYVGYYTYSSTKCNKWTTYKTCTGEQICNAVKKACCKESWTPSTSNYCAGVAFTQTDNCGLYTRTAYGTKQPVDGGWSSWSTCVNGIQTRTCTNPTPQCGGSYCVGPDSRCCTYSWSPDPSTVCSGVTFTQTSNCGETRSAVGTKTTGECCLDTTWTPNNDTVCVGRNLTQTSNCGRTRIVNGTRNCCGFRTTAWTEDSAIIGSPVDLTLNTTNCSNNEKINFTIYKYVPLGANLTVVAINSTLISNYSEIEWTIPLDEGSYFYNVTLVSNKSISLKSSMLSANPIPPSCGNGNIDSGEDCDGSNLGGNSCTSIAGGFTGGTLSCTSVCQFNTTRCTGGENVEKCSDYESESECNANGDMEIAETECPADKVCTCKWTNGACTTVYINQQGDCNYLCAMNLVDETECTDDVKTVTLSSTIVPTGSSTAEQCEDVVDPDCSGTSSVEVPCGLVGLDLPFFGWFNFAAASGLIIIIYGFYLRKR